MKIYLAIPYSFNPELSFKIANKVTARLMEAGHVVFSPISHSHSIQQFLPVECHTHDFWMEQDLPLVEWADELYMVIIGEEGDRLCANSKGVQMELTHARKFNKKVTIYDYYD